MDRRKIIFEDFFDNDDTIVQDDELIDTQEDTTDYTHYFHIHFNTPMGLAKHESYPQLYANKIRRAIKVTRKIFDSFHAIYDYSDIIVSKDRLQICDKTINIDGIDVVYSSSINNGTYRCGMVFVPDKVILNVKVVCNFTSFVLLRRFLDVLFSINDMNNLYACATLVVDNLKNVEIKSEVMATARWDNCKKTIDRSNKSLLGKFINILCKPGVYNQYLKKFNNIETEYIKDKYRVGNEILIEKDNINYKPVKPQNIVLYECGTGQEVVSFEYDYDKKEYTDLYTPLADLYIDENDYNDICQKIMKQIEHRESEYTLLVFNKFNKHTYVYYVFNDTFVYKGREYIVMLYAEITDWDDTKGTAYCLNMLRNAGLYDELAEKKLGFFYRAEILDLAERYINRELQIK